MAEIINVVLSSEDEICEVTPILARRKVSKCLNPECRSGLNLVRAQDKIRRYFGVTAHKKKTKICETCLQNTIIQKESLISHIRCGYNVMDQRLSLHKNTMILTDSESDKTDDEEWEDDSEVEYDLNELSKTYINNLKSNNDIEDLKDVITDVMSELRLSEHIKSGKQVINERLCKAEKDFHSLDNEYRSIENDIDMLRKDFYDAFTSEIKWLPSLDIGHTDAGNDLEITEVISDQPQLIKVQLPPIGPLQTPQLKAAEKVFSIKNSSFAPWMQAIVKDIDKIETSETFYTVQYNKYYKDPHSSVFGQKVVSGKKLAYFTECPTRVEVGIRIIAKFQEDDQSVQENGSWYVGIVAEVPTVTNNYRYLIFFDDGYAQYIYHKDLRVVTQSSDPSWEDVASESKEFIKDYIQTYPERPMVRLTTNNLIKTELNGKWYNAQVLAIDGSLAKMCFPNESRTEWIYRGSTRLSPLFNKKISFLNQAELLKNNQIVRRRTAPSNRGPVVEYINFQHGQDEENGGNNQEILKPIEKRAVARKSTAAKANTGMSVALIHMKQNLLLETKGDFKLQPIISDSKKFTRHQCNSNCLGSEPPVKSFKFSPLYTPISYGWKRQIVLQRKRTVTKMFVNYVAPCGRRLRLLEEIFRFIRITSSILEIDYFSFDYEIILEREWLSSRQLYYLSDITNGKEDMQISCVNSIDSNKPKTLIYSDVRLPSTNVGINLDPEFLVCCSCEDDCQNKDLCECWQLTIEATKMGKDKKTSSDEIGYKHRRLHEQVVTGIYECNSQCACQRNCLNKIVQFPIRQKLQLFKTARRGWGVRTLNDLPSGTFICVYVGRVLTEAEANEEGMTDGADDYYAELDFIEVTEGMKDSYEADVSDIEDDYFEEEHDSFGRRIKGDTLYKSASEIPTLSREKSSRLLARLCEKESDESEDSDYPGGRRRQAFEPINTANDSLLSKFPAKKLRELFGDDENVFIMDAKVTGNIGRYLNHSCNPNVFVQNVFVDTHDPRFPSIAFFAGTNIKAGTELTWDYSYDVDSVPGKIKYCYCQSPNCRGRLL